MSARIKNYDRCERGFTLSETIIVVFLVGVLSAIVINSVQNSLERARMASCMNELRGIQAALWYDSDGGNDAVDPKTFWDTHYGGSKPGPYVLLVDGEESSGGSAAKSSAGQDDPAFVVVGRYDYWAPGQYVFIEDDQPPRVVTGLNDDPGYGGQIDWEVGRAYGETIPAAAGPAAEPSWSGSRGTMGEFSSSGGGGASGGQGGRREAAPAGGGTSSSGSSGRSTSSRIGD